MRTTLNIDDDVLDAVKERARRENRTIGAVISELARATLDAPRPAEVLEPSSLFGFRPFPNQGGVATNELVHKLREEDAY